MWFLGLVLGAIAGSTIGGIVDAIGSGAGAVLGAVVGIAAGLTVARKAHTTHDARVQRLEEALRNLQTRIGELERRQVVESTIALRAADTVRPAVPAVASERSVTSVASDPAAPSRTVEIPPSAVSEDVAQATLDSAREEAATPSAKVSPAPAREPEAVGPQLLGIAIGAVIGLVAGFQGMAIGALIGGLIAWALVSQNRRAAHEREAGLGARGAREARQATSAPAARPAGISPLTADTAGAQAAVHSAEPVDERWPTLLQRLLGGNIVAKIGVLILFFGVGFLLKYAYDQGRLPVQVRLATVAAFGFAMLYVGWRLLEKRRLYGLILQGGGIGLLYLDVFFALRLYGLIGATPGFAAFLALGIAATLLAVRQDAKVLAVLGLTGAFLAPILASTDSGDHVLLFSYYTLLNAFILAISWFKAWRDLNLVGFIFTFAVSLLWGANNYRPELFATVEPFVLVFFAMYLVIPILFAQRQPPELKGFVDGTLVFGTPICAAFMQYGLVTDMPYGLAWSAGIAAVLYAALAVMALRRAGLRLLGETYIALAVVFLTLAIFFAFDAYPTFALWTLEGAAIVWVGLRQRRLLARLFGLGLQLAGAAYFLTQYDEYELSNPWWNGFVLGCVIIAAAGFIIAWLLHRYRDARADLEPTDALMVVWGGSWWSIAGVHALHHAYPWQSFVIALLAFMTASVLAVELIGSRLQWTALRRVATVIAPGMVLVFLLQAAHGAHPFAHYGWLMWPVAVGMVYFILRRQERDGLALFASAQHLAAFWLALVVLTWDAAWQIDNAGFGRPWVMAVSGLLPALAIAWISSSGRAVWPFGVHYTSVYRDRALGVVVVCLTLWVFYANLSAPGEMRPLPTLPLLNPLDVANLIVFAAIWRWWRTVDAVAAPANSIAVPLYAALVFLWINAVMLRTIHYWTGIDYEWQALTHSMLVQSGFSLLWTATAFVLMLYATRVGRRQLWVVGAALLGVVVLKLFVNDLSNTGTVARIVSFIGVGAGLLLIGYVAPVPPGQIERQAD